ncbi:hypothetical protein D3C81_1152170 [compost metagenome]
MPRTYAVWSAPRVDNLAHSNIRLDCEPATVRALWKAVTKQNCLDVLAAHFARSMPPGATSHTDQAEAFFETHLWENGKMRSMPAHKRAMLNTLAGFDGVETLGLHTRAWKDVYYCNAGDTYVPTLCFMGRRLFVSSWGDLIESRRVRPYNQQ